jgi:hypothetical protein
VKSRELGVGGLIDETNRFEGKLGSEDLAIYTSISYGGPWSKLENQQPNAGFQTAAVPQTGFFFIGRPASDDADCH